MPGVTAFTHKLNVVNSNNHNENTKERQKEESDANTIEKQQ